MLCINLLVCFHFLNKYYDDTSAYYMLIRIYFSITLYVLCIIHIHNLVYVKSDISLWNEKMLSQLHHYIVQYYNRKYYVLFIS